VKAVFLLGCYGCIFHGTGNSAQLCQNFGISGGLKPPPVRHWTEVTMLTVAFRNFTNAPEHQIKNYGHYLNLNIKTLV